MIRNHVSIIQKQVLLSNLDHKISYLLEKYDYEQNSDLENIHTMNSCKIKCTVPGDLKKKLILENVDI